MENNERPNGGVLPEKDTKIQLVVNRPETDEMTIDLGRVFHNAKVLSRIYCEFFLWVPLKPNSKLLNQHSRMNYLNFHDISD